MAVLQPAAKSAFEHFGRRCMDAAQSLSNWACTVAGRPAMTLGSSGIVLGSPYGRLPPAGVDECQGASLDEIALDGVVGNPRHRRAFGRGLAEKWRIRRSAIFGEYKATSVEGALRQAARNQIRKCARE
jgi:hypothetical protein